MAKRPAPTRYHPLEYDGDVWPCPVTGIPVAKGRATNLSQRNLIRLTASADVKQQAMWVAACTASPILWCNLFAWTYHVREVEPDGRMRPSRQEEVQSPFITWRVQDTALLELLDAIDSGSNALIDKSREMGASWLLIMLAVWYWLFRANSHVLFVSRVEGDVDRAGDPDSMMWKADYLVEHLPDWMRPGPIEWFVRGGKYRQHLQLTNPATKASITGRASTEHVGRGGRRTWALFDEMAAMQMAKSAWSTASDTTASKIANSTPLGAGTEFTRLRNEGLVSGDPRVITLGYWDHPQKGVYRKWMQDVKGTVTGTTGRWYWSTPFFEREAKRRTRQDVGQNLLIDHITSGNAFFNTAVVTEMIADRACDPDRYRLDRNNGRFEPEETGPWFLWCPVSPKTGRPMRRKGTAPRSIVLFADVSNGLGQSNSTCAALDIDTGEIIGEFADPNITPYDLAAELCSAGMTVWRHPQAGEALLGWESNGPGEALYRYVSETGYTFVYFQRQLGVRAERRTRRYGWRSGRREKLILLQGLDKALTRREVTIYSRPGLEEALQYVYYDNGSIGPGHLQDESSGAAAAHGDRVIAYAGAHLLRSEWPRFEKEKQTYKPGSLGQLLKHEEVMG